MDTLPALLSEIEVALDWSDDASVRLAASLPGSASPWTPRPLVEIFTADEQRARTSEGYLRSSVGERLRHRDIGREDSERSSVLEVVQEDPITGLTVTTRLEAPAGLPALRVVSTVTNQGDAELILTGATTLSIGVPTGPGARLLSARSEWLGEGRWAEQDLDAVLPDLSLPFHHQDARGKFAQASRGTWSTGGAMPSGMLVDGAGHALAWQIESAGGWLWELSRLRDGARLTLAGPQDVEHHFAVRLRRGESFSTVPAAIVLSSEGQDGGFAELTRYRRWLRAPRAAGRALPLVYNDFMNTLMGNPTTERVLPLVAAAADAGAEVYCIDAGWYADEPSWWDSVGEWLPSERRFPGGLGEVADAIRAAGLRVGLWLEPEAVGVRSPLASRLPEDAFFRRFGRRVTENGRYQLDLRSPAAREHLDEVVDRLVRDFGVSFLKLDYNINPGPGTERDGEAAGAGLLGHARAFADWMRGVQERHPELDLENCGSGGMRMDYQLLEVADLQSMTDQQDFVREAVVSAAGPSLVLPEQCGNWAYPSTGMTDEETAYALAGGVLGRLYLSGFLDKLGAEQRQLVRAATALHREWRDRIAEAVPSWPLGLPGWEEETFALALTAGDACLLGVWSRGDGGVVSVPGYAGWTAAQVFPPDAGAVAATVEGELELTLPAGPAARILLLQRPVA